LFEFVVPPGSSLEFRSGFSHNSSGAGSITAVISVVTAEGFHSKGVSHEDGFSES